MYSYFLFILLSCCITHKLPAVSEESIFHSEFNHYSGENIEEIAIMGSQASGTVHLLSLVKKNFPKYLLHAENGHKFPHRHFFPWFDLIKFQISKKKDINANHLEIEKNCLNDSEKCLFIYITKNAYDTLNLHYLESASHNTPEQNNEKESFFQWISTPWNGTLYHHDKFNTEAWNPYEGRIFNNVLELRKYRILNFLQIGSLVNNFMFVRYEDLIQNPEKFINFIAENFHLEQKIPFQEVSLLKLDWIRSLFHKKGTSISTEDLNFISQNLDWEVENTIGYRKNNEEK